MKSYIIECIIIFLFIFILLPECSKSTTCTDSNCGVNSYSSYKCSGSSCSTSYCKPKYSFGICYYCNSYLEVYYTIDPSGNCLINECIGDKILYSTKECTFQPISHNYYQLGNFFYREQSFIPNTECIKYGVYYVCKCKSYYYIETIYGKKLYKCFSGITGIDTDIKYCNSKTKECFKDRCPSGFIIEKPNGIRDSAYSINRCSDSCENNEWYISIKYSDNTISEYCVDSCSSSNSPDINYNHEYVNNGIKKCLNECPTGTYKKVTSSKISCVPKEECPYYKSGSSDCLTSCSSPNLYNNFDSNECIGACSGEYLYKYGNVCYRKEDCNFIVETDSDNNCILSGSTCYGSYPYHDYNSKLCISQCGVRNGINIYRTSDGKICYPSCADIPGGYYIYEEKDNTNSYKICSDTKPSDCEVYYQKTDGVLKCITKSDCINILNYNYFLGDECRISCDGYYKFEYEESSSSLKYIKCFESLGDVLDDSYHVKFCDTFQKKCWKSFPTDGTYYVVSLFSTSYNDQYEVTKECSNFYYLKTGSGDDSYNKYWCVTNCYNTNPNLYFLRGNKKCLDSCNEVFKYYYDPTNNECLDSCELRPDKPFSYSITGTNLEKCLATCDTSKGQFYSYNSHICLDKCNDDRSGNLYYALGSKICYPSCLDIPGGVYKYEYKNNECSTTEPIDSPNCYYNYVKSNGIIKCAEAEDCRDLNYFYLLGKECKKTCEDFYYKLDITLTIDSEAVHFVKCYLTPSECQQSNTLGAGRLIYYNVRLRQCWTDYKEGYYIKIIDTTKYELVEECENFYYVRQESGQDRNYCTLTCNAVTYDTFYFLKGIKKCEKTCKKFSKSYYHPDTRECLDSCEGIANYTFQVEPTGPDYDPLPCLSSCPTLDKPYHNYDSNICLERCGADGSNKKYHKAGDHTCYSSCIEIGDGLYLYAYLEDETHDVYSCYDRNSLPASFEDNCPFYYLKNDGTKKCQTAKECKDRNYIYLLYGECRDRCDEYYKIEKPIEIGSGQIYTFYNCFLTSLECYTVDNTNNDKIYFFEKLKRCWKRFPSGYFIKSFSTSSTVNELVEKCENFYYVENGLNICTEACKTGTQNLFFLEGNNKCVTNCIEFQKNYYDQNNECLDTCEGRTLKYQIPITDTINPAIKCLETCPTNNPSLPYHDSDSNVCIASCAGNKKYYANDQFICYSSCAEIPSAEYVYEYNDICYLTPPNIVGACEYYYTKSDGTRKCTTMIDCISNMKFIYFINNECKDNCDGYYKLEKTEGTLKYTQCFDSINDVLNAGTEIIAYDIKNKLCWKEIPSDYYVNNIDATSNKYEVIKECEFFYYTDSSINHKRCTLSCKGATTIGLYFIKNQKKCDENCLVFKKHYFNPENNECLDTCKGLANYEYSLQLSSTTDFKSCIAACPIHPDTLNYYFHNYNSNICIQKCGDDNPNNLYHLDNGYICYPSCKEIPGGDYKYELEQTNNIKTCYDTIPSSCLYYYMKRDGSLKCLESSDKCLEMKYNYVLGQECKTECNDYYKLEDLDPIQCFKTKDDCVSSNSGSPLYYNMKLKKCWINFPNGYYIYQKDNANKYEIVQECEKYYFLDSDYGNYYHCINKCSESDATHLYYYKEEKNCEESCTAFNKYYFDPTNHECLDTCIGRKTGTTYIEFSDEIDYSTEQPVECKQGCGSGQHYNYGTKICLSGTSCDDNKYTRNGENGVCYDSCSEIPGVNKIYEIGTACYRENEISNFDNNCRYYYKKDEKTFKCVTTQNDCINEGYNFLYGRECKKNCDNYYKLIEEDNLIRCFDNYEDAYIADPTFIYYDITLKQCWKEMPDGYYIQYIKYDNIGRVNYEIVQACENYYYEKEVDSKTYNYCIDNCKDVNLFFILDNKKCVSSCKDLQLYYFDPTNYECLLTCVGKNNLEYALPVVDNEPQECIQKCPNSRYFINKIETNNPSIIHYECVENCPYNDGYQSYQFLDIKKKECRTSCSPYQYFVIGDICYPICDVSQNYFYISNDNFECLIACPPELKKMDKLGTLDGKDIFLCKSRCEINQFRLGDECLEKCPKEFNFIGYNNICKKKCAGDLNGEHYYPINEDEANPPEYLIYKCIDSCNEAIIDSGDNYLYHEQSKPNICLRKCPPESPFYLATNNKECIASCPFNLPFYDKSSNDNYYECKTENPCNAGISNYFLDGNCYTINQCATDHNKKYIDSRNICMDSCPETEIKKKIESYGDSIAYKCLRNCLGDFILQLSIEDEPECVEYCPNEKKYIGKDNICKQSCEEEDGLYYYQVDQKPVPNSDPQSTYFIYKCVDGCKADYDGYKYREANNGNQCYQTCTENYPYLSEVENLCYDDCLKSKQNPFTLAYDNVNKCADKCDDTTDYKYWGQNKKCIASCWELSDTRIIDYNNQCVSKCNFLSTYKFELEKKCVEACDDDNKKYSLGDYKCKPKCVDGEYIINENQCVTTCNLYINKISTGEKECIPACAGDNIYYYPNQKICLDHCNTGHKVVDVLNICVRNCDELNDNKYYYYETEGPDDDFRKHNACVLNCPDKTPYIYDGKCVNYCPERKKYFVESVNNIHKLCLTDCPAEYPYYTITQDLTDTTKSHYPCKEVCSGYFVPNEETSIIAKLCLDDCSYNNNNGYIYKLEYEENNKLIKKCYKQCPIEYKYHFILSSSSDDNNCYKTCPAEKRAPYHRRGETICLKQSELNYLGFLLYDIKEWTNTITQCPDEYPLYSITEDSKQITVCLKECNFNYYNEAINEYYLYGYLTQYNTCVKDCSTVSDKYLKNDELNKKCICENLFYIDETNFKITCYPNSKTQCKDTTNPQSPLPLHGTKQCLKTCSNNRILTPSEDDCYEANTTCSSIESYSYTKLITKSDGQKKCECAYTFYYEGLKKVCLAENSVCPEEKNLFIPYTLECVESCPSTYPYKFKNFCLSRCPKGSTLDSVNKICDCGDKFWYETSPGNYECLEGNCLDDYPVYAPKTKQCLKTCKGSYYKYLYDNKCYDNCDFIHNIEEMEIDSPLAQYKCDCKQPWYYDIDNNNINIMYCPPNDNSIKKCKDYINKGLLYMIDSTRQCVKNCPKEYPYFFNNKCFVSCDYANELYRYNAEKVEYSYECRCPNLWSIDPDDPYETDKICYQKNITECDITLDETGKSTTYYIPSKKQCVHSRDKCPANSYKFNYICYDQCPEFTLEAKETLSGDVIDNICTCNKNGFLWLEYKKYGNTYYKCGLSSCPEVFIDGEQEFVRKNLLESENKCVKSCLEDGGQNNKYLYSFRNKCFQECPSLTEKIYDDCVFYDLNDEDKIHNLDELKESANVQAKELYEKSDHLSGYLMNKYDASLQIYSINKFNSYKDLAMKSNLTYIDLGTCLERIFEDNHLADTDKILVTKYDLLTRLTRNDKKIDNNNDDSAQISYDNKFLINQVEYEFYLESTNEKIEGSICSPHEILISYPISFNKNKFNNYESGHNDNNYLKLFERGKKLHEQNSEFDTFNKDNIIYKDFCKSVVIDGKDLVFEDRYKYLYPNNKSLCESNCTMNNTDFELERINCNCTYKEIFDFYRIDKDTNDILNDPNFVKPSQWGANGEILKCLKKIDIKEGLLKNEAFYFSGVIMIVQLSMIIASSIQGVKTIASFTQGMLSKNGIKINFNGDIKNNNQGPNSVNRYLNNPPKRGNDNNESNENYYNIHKKKNIVINKNLLLNYLPYDNMSKKDEKELYINNNINMKNDNKELKKDYIKTKKQSELQDDNYKITEMNSHHNTINIYPNKKAEFMPIEYNFKFFKPNDKGVWKKIRRSQIPFKIGRDTKILLEFKNNVFYHKNYLEGPFYEDQNLLEIIEESDLNGIINDKRIIRFRDDINEDSNNMMLRNTKYHFNNNNGLIQREEIYKTKKRITPVIRINKEEIGKEKDFIKIRKIRPINNLNMSIEEYKENEEVKPKVHVKASIYYLIKREHTYLRASYNLYISKLHPNALAVILAEIFDKIYLIKIFLLLKQFDIFSVHLSLYMFCHILLLSLICGFFTTNTIKKIWEEENYPNINFYLLFGFLANVIIWIIYKIFILLLDNQDRIRTLVQKNDDDMSINTYISKIKENNSDNISSNSNNINQKKQQDIEEKYNQLIKKIRIQIALYYIVISIFTVFCSIYLVSFSAFYTGTKKYVFKTYYISIIEIIIIKFVYGLSLASFRIASEVNEYKSLYNFVYICDKYLA